MRVAFVHMAYDSADHKAIAPTEQLIFISYFVFGSLYFSQISARSDINKIAQ